MERIQNSDLQNSDCYKTVTTTKQRLLQNGEYYKTMTVTKKIFLYIQQKHYVAIHLIW